MPAAARASAGVTGLLVAWSEGDPQALPALIPLVYGELRRLAGSCLRRERPEHTLQATALVHEAYLRLVDQRAVRWQGRAHFFAIAARLMRRILLDHARRRAAIRRGKAAGRAPLEEAETIVVPEAPDLVALDEALVALSALDDEKASIVEMRFFGGLSDREIAAVLGLSEATVSRRWRVARAWLYRRLGSPP